MKSYKRLLNEAMNTSGLRKITETEAKAMKQCLMQIYLDIETLCKKNDLCIMLTGGSCLGAVRHKGFIPWDDDIDVMMPRPDYEKLIELLEAGALGKNYEFVYPSNKIESPMTWLQIYRKDTLLVTLGGPRKKFPNGCYVDVFPIEGVPSSNFVRHCKAFVSNSLRIIANTVGELYDDESADLEDFYDSNKELKKMVTYRKWFGRMFSFVSHKTWIWWFDRWARNTDMSGWVGIPTGRGLYYNESHPASVFFPPQEGEFEGRKVLLPANYDAYLSRLYGDYMQIPPVEKRESHFIKELRLPEEFYKD